MKLHYVAPSGDETKDLDIDELIAMVRKGGKSYWDVGAGGALLSRGPIGNGPSMQIYRVPGEGFHLIVKSGRKGPLAAEPGKPPAKPRRALIYVGGDPTEISTDQCVPPEEAEKIIRYFAEHGKAAPDQKWGEPR